MILPEDVFGEILKLTDYGLMMLGDLDWNDQAFVGGWAQSEDREPIYWMLVKITEKKHYYNAGELLSEPDRSREAIYELVFIIKDREYTLQRVIGKEFSKIFEVVQNEVK